MIIEIIMPYMAFDVSKYPLCNIENWTIWWQMKLYVSNISKSLLNFTRSMKRDIVHGDEPLSMKARNDLGLNDF